MGDLPAGTRAIVLTFLAGAELDPRVLRTKWKEASAIGLVSFAAPFLGCTAVAYWGLDWSVPSSWLAGIAMSTTSVAVVYAVMLEFGFNATDYGKTVLVACFITDLATVLALGFIFAPFTLSEMRRRLRRLTSSACSWSLSLRWRSSANARPCESGAASYWSGPASLCWRSSVDPVPATSTPRPFRRAVNGGATHGELL